MIFQPLITLKNIWALKLFIKLITFLSYFKSHLDWGSTLQIDHMKDLETKGCCIMEDIKDNDLEVLTT